VHAGGRRRRDSCWCRWPTTLERAWIGTASTEERAKLAREPERTRSSSTRRTDFEVETKRLDRHDKGLEVVYDSWERPISRRVLNVLRPRG